MSGQRQQGLALVTVLLIMALMGLLLSGMLRSHQLMVAGVAQQLESTQLLQLALAGEQLFMREVSEQAMTGLVHAGQGWARPRQLDVPGGRLQLRGEDLAGRLNLGALTARERPDPLLLDRWLRLCAALQIDPPSLQPLHGQQLLDISQLRQLLGISPPLLARLRPWLAVLPADAGLNVNSMPPQRLAVLTGLAPQGFEQVLADRPEAGHATVQGFLASAAAAGLAIQGQGLAVTSRWLRGEIIAERDGQQLYLYSDLEIHRRTQQVQVVRRYISAVPERQTDE